MFSRVVFRGPRNKSDDEDTDPSLLKKCVTIKENRVISKDYIIGEYLGSGKFGEVKRCQEKRTDRQFAAKFVPIASAEDWDSVTNEIDIMNKLRHPRLIQLYDAYSYKDEVVMVLELITGGELFERIIDESFDLNESRCIRFMNEILQGVEYIHAQGVVHLDLKPENILCLSKTSFKIKIIDFGLARFYDGTEICVLFGTPEFVSPEVISYDPVTPAADMWSIGVICYVILSGLSPFMGDSQGETLANILRVTYDFDYPEFDEISEGAREFIRHLLLKNPRKRLTASECLEHPWIRRKQELKRKGTVSKRRLKHFVYRRKWQKAVNAIIALLRMGVVLHHTHSDEGLGAENLVAPTQTSKAQTSLETKQLVEPIDKQRKSETTKEPLKRMERRLSSLFSGKSLRRTAEGESSSPKSSSPKTTSRRPSILRKFSKRESLGELTVQKKETKENSEISRDSLKGSQVKTQTKSTRMAKVKFDDDLTTAVKPNRHQTEKRESIKEKVVISKDNKTLSPINDSSFGMCNSSPGDTRTEQVKRKSGPGVIIESKMVTQKQKLTDPNPKRTSTCTGMESTGIATIATTTTTTTTDKPVVEKTKEHSLSPGHSNTRHQRKVAPATGGIAAKIGFFSNLQQQPRAKSKR